LAAVLLDGILTILLFLGLATLVTVHVALAVRLVRRQPRWRGLVALVVPPLAVMWAFREGWRRTAVLWLGAVAVYAAALTVALARA
jgi:hypothetical protein